MMRNFFPSTIKLMSKLCDQSRATLLIGLFESPASERRNTPGNRDHRHQDGKREHRQKSAPENHGLSTASQTFGISQLPSRAVLQFLTVLDTPFAVRGWSRGITRCDCSSLFSVA